MANATFEYIRPLAGGGLGDCKIGIIEFKGDYVTGGFNIGIGVNTPIFAAADNGFGVSFGGSKLKLTTLGGGAGGSVIIPEQTITGITASVGDIVVAGADIVEDAYPGETITGVSATVGDVVIPSKTISITGGGGAGGELAGGTDITGVKVIIVVKGGF